MLGGEKKMTRTESKEGAKREKANSKFSSSRGKDNWLIKIMAFVEGC